MSHLKGLPFDFESAVAEYIKAKMAHRFTVGEPAPWAPHPWVEYAVKRVPGGEGQPDDFVADYEIEDDIPPPPTLDERKQALAVKAHADAAEAQGALIPPLKARFWHIEFARVSAAVAAVQPIAATRGKDGKPDAPAETPEALRTRALATLKSDDSTFFLQHESRLKALDRIQYHLAILESEIHDLTEATIDTWTPAPFPAA